MSRVNTPPSSRKLVVILQRVEHTVQRRRDLQDVGGVARRQLVRRFTPTGAVPRP
jgi:hypothetical protein